MARIKQITFIIGICGICLSSSAQIEPDSILLEDRKPVVGTFNGVNRNLNSALKWDRFTGSVYFDGYLNLNAARPLKTIPKQHRPRWGGAMSLTFH